MVWTLDGLGMDMNKQTRTQTDIRHHGRAPLALARGLRLSLRARAHRELVASRGRVMARAYSSVHGFVNRTNMGLWFRSHGLSFRCTRVTRRASARTSRCCALLRSVWRRAPRYRLDNVVARFPVACGCCCGRARGSSTLCLPRFAALYAGNARHAFNTATPLPATRTCRRFSLPHYAPPSRSSAGFRDALPTHGHCLPFLLTTLYRACRSPLHGRPLRTRPHALPTASLPVRCNCNTRDCRARFGAADTTFARTYHYAAILPLLPLQLTAGLRYACSRCRELHCQSGCARGLHLARSTRSRVAHRLGALPHSANVFRQ